MDPRLFDVLHDATDIEALAVIEGVDVDFYGIVQEVVYQKRVGVIDQRVLSNAVEIALEALFVIDNFHTPTAKNKRRSHQHRVADPSCDLDRLSQIRGGAICRRDKSGVVKN